MAQRNKLADAYLWGGYLPGGMGKDAWGSASDEEIGRNAYIFRSIVRVGCIGYGAAFPAFPGVYLTLRIVNPETSTPNTSKRRLFLGAGLEYFQIFSISQNERDSSIYFSAPQSEDIQWHLPALNEDHQPILISYQLEEPGKLSLHGSGMVHAKAFGVAGSNEFAVRGNMLRSQDGSVLSVRHLLTVFPSEPRQKPNSPAGARKTDCLMTTKEWHPYVIIFWAVPLTRSFTVQVNGSFHIEDLEEVPPNGGWGGFNLATHAIVWFAYRTKYMNQWPKNSQAFYSDGHTVPVFVGTGIGEFRLEYRQPSYTVNDNQLNITL